MKRCRFSMVYLNSGSICLWALLRTVCVWGQADGGVAPRCWQITWGGTIDIEKALTQGKKAFEPGLLAKANRGILYVDEARRDGASVIFFKESGAPWYRWQKQLREKSSGSWFQVMSGSFLVHEPAKGNQKNLKLICSLERLTSWTTIWWTSCWIVLLADGTPWSVRHQFFCFQMLDIAGFQPFQEAWNMFKAIVSNDLDLNPSIFMDSRSPKNHQIHTPNIFSAKA